MRRCCSSSPTPWRGPGAVFDLTDTEELPRYLKRTKITSAQFQGMVCAVRDAKLSLATSRGMATSFLRFDPGMVRATPEGRLRFALVPMAGVPAVAENSPSFILRFLGEHARFVVGDDSRHAEALLDFVRRNQVLSLSAFNAFLKAQFGTASLGASAVGATGEGDASAQAIPTPAASGRTAGHGDSLSSSVGSARAAFDPISMLQRPLRRGDHGLAERLRSRPHGNRRDLSHGGTPADGRCSRAAVGRHHAPRRTGVLAFRTRSASAPVHLPRT